MERKEIRINVATIGHIDHGKTTLTAAITKYASKINSNNKAFDYNQIDKSPEERQRGITINSTTVEYKIQTKKDYDLCVAHTDCPGHRSFVKNMIVGASQADCAILVVAATDGIMPQTREHVLLAKQTGVKQIIIVLNKCDVADPDLVSIVEMDVKELLEKHNFDKDAPVIHLSALKAYNGDPEEEKKIQLLLDTMAEYIKKPVRDEDKPFLLPIEDVLSISGRGTVVTGKIERGTCKVGDNVEVIGIKEKRSSVITGLEAFKKGLPKASAGENVGILLRGFQRDDVVRGQVLAAPNSIKEYSKFTAQVYVLKADEGGRKYPFSKRFSPQAFIRTADVTCNFEFPEGVESVIPGDNILLTIKILHPLAIEKGTNITFREGGSTIAAGKVVEVLE